MVDGVTTWTWSTDDQGWPTEADKSTTGANPDVVYTFDPDGDLTGADDQLTNPNDLTFGYDSWGLTSSATVGSTGVGYSLDPLGRTASRTVGGATTTYAYSGSGEDLATSTLSSTTTKYAYGPGGPLSTKVGSGTASLYVPDVHGDVVATISSGASSLTDTAWYDPYGERTTLAGSATQLGYQGDYTDASTGAVDMTTRWYLPSLGRFTSRDVLGGDPHDPPSLNQFVYVNGNPVSYSDPSGMGCSEGGHTVACTSVVDDLDTNGPRGGGAGGGGGGTYVPPDPNGGVLCSCPIPDHPVIFCFDCEPRDPPPLTGIGNCGDPQPSILSGLVFLDTTSCGSGTSAGGIIDGPDSSGLGGLLHPPGSVIECTCVGDGFLSGGVDRFINHADSGKDGGGKGSAGTPDRGPQKGRLPTGGEFPHIPPKGYHGKPAPLPGGQGFKDRKGNVWMWDHSGHAGPHWDVQQPDGTHINVDPDGNIISGGGGGL